MMYQRATETLVEEFSLPRVQKALESFLTRQRFFPHPSQIREVLESMRAKERRDELAANRYAPDPKCDHVPGGLFRRTEGGMARCDCWQRWKHSMSRLGIPQVPGPVGSSSARKKECVNDR
jgi:hypothetical protein